MTTIIFMEFSSLNLWTLANIPYSSKACQTMHEQFIASFILTATPEQD